MDPNQTQPAVITSTRLADLPNYFGLYFDRETGHSYRADGTDTGYTFEDAKWTGPFGMHFQWPYLNPFGFATHETAEAMLKMCESVVPEGVTVSLDENQTITGPFTRTVERRIVVAGNGNSEQFSAGTLASSVIRNGVVQAMAGWFGELRLAGLIPQLVAPIQVNG